MNDYDLWHVMHKEKQLNWLDQYYITMFQIVQLIRIILNNLLSPITHQLLSLREASIVVYSQSFFLLKTNLTKWSYSMRYNTIKIQIRMEWNVESFSFPFLEHRMFLIYKPLRNPWLKISFSLILKLFHQTKTLQSQVQSQKPYSFKT